MGNKWEKRIGKKNDAEGNEGGRRANANISDRDERLIDVNEKGSDLNSNKDSNTDNCNITDY